MNELVIACSLAVFITWLAMYVDSKLFDEPRSKITYIKNILLNVCITWVVMYFFTNIKMQFGGGSKCAVASNTSMLSSINQEIMTGMPPF